MKELAAIVRHMTAEDAREGDVLATLVTVDGSSYRRPGARLLVTPAGERIGSISGGCLEEDVLARARAVAGTGRADVVVYDTTSENDLVWGVGLGCHGVVRVLLERVPRRPAWALALAANFRDNRSSRIAAVWESADPRRMGTGLANDEPSSPAERASPHQAGDRIFLEEVEPPSRLFIFGAGDDARPLSRMAKELGWHVTVADPRPAFATAGRFPEADSMVTAPADRLAGRAAPGASALAVVMTHHYVHDVPILRDLLARPLAFLGLLGPKMRGDRILDNLARDGLAVTPEMRARLHAPVGLDIGAEAPEEVALSILAEMQAALAGRDGRPLKERTRPIHDVSTSGT